MSANVWWDIVEKEGYREAFKGLLKQHGRDQKHWDDCSKSRFYRWQAGTEDTPPAWVRVTEAQVSSAFDLADVEDETNSFYWLDDDGKFYQVTANNPGSGLTPAGVDEHYQECPHSVLTWPGPLMANGKRVGTVMFSDH